MSLCLRILDNLVVGAYPFLFTNFGLRPSTLKILFVPVLFVFTEAIEPVVSGRLRAALCGAFFQQRFGIQSQEWSAELTLAVYKCIQIEERE